MSKKKIKDTPNSPSPPQPPTPDAPTESLPSELGHKSSGDDNNEHHKVSEEINENSVFIRPLALTETALDDELVISDLLINRSFRLNTTGVDIWRRLGSQQSVGAVASALASQFNLERDEAVKVVQQYAESLLSAILLTKPEN